MAIPSPSTEALLRALQQFLRRDVSFLLQTETLQTEHLQADAETLPAELKTLGCSELKTPGNWPGLKQQLDGFAGRIVGWFDEEYPEVWRHIPDPPVVYFILGAPLSQVVLTSRLIAVVGSRRASAYGRMVTAELVQQLVAGHAGVISGLAYGIDAAAHEACLRHGGITIAVLGSGLAKIYPAAHRGLARQIVASGGALVSEYAPDQSPRPHHFLERNRLISGLAASVVVVEAAARSGALNTARWAAEQGREVWAVPGDITRPQAAGCHQLISQGAGIVASLTDILGEQATQDATDRRAQTPDDDLDQQLFSFCREQTRTLDELLLLMAGQLDVTQLQARLSQLELAGIVQSTTLGYIARAATSL